MIIIIVSHKLYFFFFIVRFKCSGGAMSDSIERSLEDPSAGVRLMEAEVSVSREQVEEYFGHDGYSCYCTAWDNRGLKSVSDSALVTVACEYIIF